MTQTYVAIPLTPLRRTIAARMAEAQRTIPHFRMITDMDADPILCMRQRLREQNPEGSPSVNDLLIKACARALMEVPTVNAQWVDNEIHQFNNANISVVISVQGGLSTPIILRAEEKTVWNIASEMRDLSARAATHGLKMEGIVGGSFSISNLGMYDVDHFDAIINSPQCAILAVGAA